jgi:hypothetical protein
LVPDQAPEAVHEVAFVEVQLKVDAPPGVIDAGLADIATVGPAVGAVPTFTTKT